MKKLSAVLVLAAFLLFLSMSTVQAADFEAVNTPIIRTSPPRDAVIISQGQGDVHTPTGFSNYYNAEWALAQTNNSQILYVWNVDNDIKFTPFDPFFILIAAFGVFMLILLIGTVMFD